MERRINLGAAQIAADARISPTNFVDDQSWELIPGTGDMPALTFQTRYGGRVGLASVVPVWHHNGRTIHEAQSYASVPQITMSTPAYVAAEAKLLPTLAVQAEYIAVESQAIIGQFTLQNTGVQTEEITLNLFGFVGRQSKTLPLAVLTLADDTYGLSLGRMVGLEPVVLLEGATAQLETLRSSSPEIGRTFTIEAGATVAIKWVHAGLTSMNESLVRAQFWLSQDWETLKQIVMNATKSIPVIRTGDAGIDAVVEAGYGHLIQALFTAASTLPNSTFVATRRPDRGYSTRGDGSDYGRGWDGQNPHLAYIVASSIASIDSTFAQDILRNYLVVQKDDGWIEMSPGAAGQSTGLLCPPILARLAWSIYQSTEDTTFLAEVFDDLARFVNRWFEVDLDADRDMIPEWQDERQTGYVFWPTFGEGQPWAQNLDISRVETPDLTAYLISELESLKQIAAVIDRSDRYELDNRINNFHRLLLLLWDDELERFVYRDRDSGISLAAEQLLSDAAADEEHILAYKLEPPHRLLIRVSGGRAKVPQASMKLEGLDEKGEKIVENATVDQFAWSYGNGVYTSENAFATVDRIAFSGLSRVFKIDVQTADYTRLDINGVLPIIADCLSAERVASLVALIKDETLFMRPSGLTIVPADDPDFDPSSANGGGGTWTYWTQLIGEGLLQHGYVTEVAEFVRRLLNTQAEVLANKGRFGEFYHSDEPLDLGERGHVGGIPPFDLFMRLVGVRILSPDRVWLDATFGWNAEVSVEQYGLTVTRSPGEIRVTFPSGHEETVTDLKTTRYVVDPSSNAIKKPLTLTPMPQPPKSTRSVAPERVMIDVVVADDDGASS